MSLEDLGRRAVACKHWRWMPGMRIVNPHRATFGHGRKAAARYCTLGFNDEAFILESKNAGSMDTPSKNDADWRPDLEDPATLGCLLALVQEAWNACRISVCFSAYTPDETKRWSVPISFFKEQRDLVHVPSFYGSTQAEALVAALEAAP
jgi:hypothetical protein